MFSAHPHHQIYRSFPACGPLLAARLCAEIGDTPDRFPTGRHLRAYAGPPSPGPPTAATRSFTPQGVQPGAEGRRPPVGVQHADPLPRLPRSVPRAPRTR
ncbi:transposase [Streptomyces scabiei]|uniref:transposase n=1 Tax=Streptomyces scabiei TaxID=1930 RepID=UPI0038F7457D